MAKKEEKKSLEEVMKDLEKQYGKGSVIHGNEQESFTEVISTGSLGLDLALGIGGLPKNGGKIIEIYGWESSGKSTITQTIMGNFQKAGQKCLLINGEDSLDEKYATALGISLGDLFVVQLDEHAGEGAYNKMEKLVETGEFGIVVIDSYNALQPLKIVSGEVGDSTLGLHARMLNQAVMKANTLAAKYGTLFIFIGQLREKIGVMFGCLHADMPIIFTDGRSFPIRKVVEEKIQGKVWSWNEKTSSFEKKEIVGWHHNGNVSTNDDFIHIDTSGIDNNKFGVTVTPSHKVLTSNGWKEAKELTTDDKLVSKYKSVLDNNDFLKGCLVGDSHLSLRSKNTASLIFQDSLNEEYVKWKTEVLSFMNFNRSGKKWKSEYTYELGKIKKDIGNRNPLLVFKDGVISDLSLAVWIMDDGHFDHSRCRYSLSVKRFSKNPYILNKIEELFLNNGIIGKCYDRKSILFNKENSLIIAKIIAKYMHSSMEYKLPLSHIYSDKINMGIKENTIIKSDLVDILNIRQSSNRQMRQKGKYDISIKDNHNYLSGGINNGVIVHNSPETTQGGNALRFYSHIRMQVSRSTTKDNSIMNGDEKLGNLTKVKIIKNKLAAPFKECQFNIMYGKGIDKISEIIELASDYDVIKKRGNSVTYGEDKFDLTVFTNMIADNEDFYNELKQQILNKVNRIPEEIKIETNESED